MNLFSPWSLLWLLPVMGGVLALWLLRRKRQDVTVSSLYLWRAVLQETQANTPFQKLRRSLLLFLQLLAAFLLVFALARPFVYGRGLAGRTLVVVLDTSASMNATDARPSRLQVAKDAAKDFLSHQMNGSDVAMVIAAGMKPVVQSGFTTNTARLDDAIDATRGTDAPGDLAAALTLAQSLLGSRQGGEIRVFTDGALSADEESKVAALNFGPTEVRQTVVGSAMPDNVGITALDARRDPGTGRLTVFAHVQSVGQSRYPGATLSLLLGGKLIDARALTLAGGSQSETFDSDLLQQGGVVTARLDDVQDALAADNQASLVLPPPQKRRILLVSAGNLFLEQGLALDPDVTLDECPLSQFATAGKSGAGYALVVFDVALPVAPLPPGNYLLFHAAGRQTPLVPAGGTVNLPGFVDQNRTQPVMRFVDLSGLHVRAAPRLTAQPWATVLADSDHGPWIAAGESQGRRMVSVAFDLSDSDWPLRVSFPIFLSNAVDWLAQGGRVGSVADAVDSGTPAEIIVPPGSDSVSIVRPDGETSAVAAPPTGGIAVYARTDRVGLYHARSADGMNYPFAVDLRDSNESALASRPLAALDRPGVPQMPSSAAPLRRVRNDLWPAVAAVALALLLLEWLVYNRRE